MYDYSNAPLPMFDLIPHGTVAAVTMQIRPGGCGEDAMLKRSAKGDCEMLDLQFVVVDGPYVKRKFWGNFVLAGTTDGHAKAVDVSRSTLRTITSWRAGSGPMT